MSVEPYKIVAYEPGAAHVVERGTDRLLGYVLKDFYGNWEPMRDGRPIGRTCRYRRDAARIVAGKVESGVAG